MKILQNNRLSPTLTKAQKYFFEKVIQTVSYDEVISNLHKTTNGFTLIAEIFTVAEICAQRDKNKYRLISLLKESTDPGVTSSIRSDSILKTYFPDIVAYYQNLEIDKLVNDAYRIRNLVQDCEIQMKRLEADYLPRLQSEIKQIDYNTTQFGRTFAQIDGLVDLLIPFLIFQGYSVTSIHQIAERLAYKATTDPIAHFLRLFEMRPRLYEFAYASATPCPFTDYLNIKGIKISKSQVAAANIDTTRGPLSSSKSFNTFEHRVVDPHNFIRQVYNGSLKYHVIKRNRNSLLNFGDFFNETYWRIPGPRQKFMVANTSLDPINVSQRHNTLLRTLGIYGGILDANGELPFIPELHNVMYFYNLSLGSKSLENSILLLWTSLETLFPFKRHTSDIANIQHYTPKFLSIGAVGRRFLGFIDRFIHSNNINNNPFNKSSCLQVEGKDSDRDFIQSVQNIVADFTNAPDPFNELDAVSPLLAKYFLMLNETFGSKSGHAATFSVIEKIHESSKISIYYQLDRIYLFRNQIVHSGKLINEYTNLWYHLEWYLGKLLSWCYVHHNSMKDPAQFSRDDAFITLEAEVDRITNLVKNNRNKPIAANQQLLSEILCHRWLYS